MSIDLAAIAKQRKVQYFFISYVDLFGGLLGAFAYTRPGDYPKGYRYRDYARLPNLSCRGRR